MRFENVVAAFTRRFHSQKTEQSNLLPYKNY